MKYLEFFEPKIFSTVLNEISYTSRKLNIRMMSPVCLMKSYFD